MRRGLLRNRCGRGRQSPLAAKEYQAIALLPQIQERRTGTDGGGNAKEASVVRGDENHWKVRLGDSAGWIHVIQTHPAAPLINRAAEGVGIFFDDFVDVRNAVGGLHEHGCAGLGTQEIELFFSGHFLERFGRSGTSK